MNHFELFGLPFQFELDNSLLASQFRELQRRFHPDNYATASERDRLLSVQKAAQINDAFQTLKNPVSRAEYMLAERDEDIRGEQKTLQDMAFLMQQMELREALEAIPDSSDPESALFDFEQQASAMYKEQLAQLAELLNNEQWLEAADGVRKLKFIVKLRDEVERLEESLFD
ncbi:MULTISPECIES: co-chaperone HscB [Photobacterium]|uniref:Co-chaperone protein HscB homolog n=1 Tax=Photobacterium angustum TaxID=661 RepID=A0A855SC13_PHOAN|nr:MULTISPECIES: co-chaperone HscB [Photobacterium]KJF80747.1 cobalamin 5'-phosphate synthase [Photobacterium damselae subsp. damselae]KJG02744.1 cobalamin 5'-phosphate synthase [Photobacterium angustum]KJG18421.1 cobalamin 5'-phosphate synthase [Photobacterium angustum]KJG26476.1 cobalamin 5'-phosphate synthase [Photobacterium angustum]KJG29405.1 cobalamin 5'-phosphate synthase [Photobacterium angustum]